MMRFSELHWESAGYTWKVHFRAVIAIITSRLAVTRSEFAGTARNGPKDNRHTTKDGHGRQIRARRSIKSDQARLFPDTNGETNGTVDRLRAEVAARRCSEYQRNVRKSSLGFSRYANRKRR